MLSAAGSLALHRAIRRAQRAVAAAETIAEWDAAWQTLYELVDGLSDDRGGRDRTPAPAMSPAVALATGQAARRRTRVKDLEVSTNT